jgi:transcriptional regulator with XRE-family HTH domain
MALRETRLFPALLRFWRERRGFSQLDLAIAAEVSARHVSFLETARSRPSQEMVLRLSSVLELPLRDRNAMLAAADLAPVFDEAALAEGLSPELAALFERMLAQHEPFPMLISNRAFDVLRANLAAQRLVSRLLAEPATLREPLNLLDLLLDPRLARSFVVNWEEVARFLFSRIQRERLERPHDARLAESAARLRSYPGLPKAWLTPDFSQAAQPTLVVHLRRDELELKFLTTVSTLNAPQSVTLEELRIDTYYALDATTDATCRRLLAAG